jgi:hypothetical protein
MSKMEIVLPLLLFNRIKIKIKKIINVIRIGKSKIVNIDGTNISLDRPAETITTIANIPILLHNSSFIIGFINKKRLTNINIFLSQSIAFRTTPCLFYLKLLRRLGFLK